VGGPESRTLDDEGLPRPATCGGATVVPPRPGRPIPRERRSRTRAAARVPGSPGVPGSGRRRRWPEPPGPGPWPRRGSRETSRPDRRANRRTGLAGTPGRPVHRRSGRAAHAVRGVASRSPAPAAPPALWPASRLRRSIVFAVSMERIPRPVSQPRSGTIHVGNASPRLAPSGSGYGRDAGCPPR